MATVLPDDSEISFVLPGIGLDSRGNQVPLKTPPTVRVSDTSLLTLVQPDPDTPENPLSGVVRAAGPLGGAQLIVEDIDDSTQPLMAVVDFTIVAGDIVALAPPTLGPIRKQAAVPTS